MFLKNKYGSIQPTQFDQQSSGQIDIRVKKSQRGSSRLDKNRIISKDDTLENKNE